MKGVKVGYGCFRDRGRLSFSIDIHHVGFSGLRRATAWLAWYCCVLSEFSNNITALYQACLGQIRMKKRQGYASGKA